METKALNSTRINTAARLSGRTCSKELGEGRGESSVQPAFLRGPKLIRRTVAVEVVARTYGSFALFFSLVMSEPQWEHSSYQPLNSSLSSVPSAWAIRRAVSMFGR